MEKTSKKSKIEPVHIEEAARLKRLFDARSTTSQMKFGADNEIGSQGMVWQYLNARAPLNLDAALKFAKGLGCPAGPDHHQRTKRRTSTDGGTAQQVIRRTALSRLWAAFLRPSLGRGVGM